MLQKDGLVWWFLLSVYFIMLQLIVQWSFCMERALWEFFMFLTRKSRLVFTFCNFLLLFTEEPEMNRWWTTVRWTSRWTRSSFWHLHWPRICHFICQAERSVSWSGHLRPLSLSHKHTHTLLYFITVTLNLACSAFELSISGDITSLTSLPPLKERLIRSNCSRPIRSGHLFLHLRTGFTWTWWNQHYVTVGLHNSWDIYRLY